MKNSCKQGEKEYVSPVIEFINCHSEESILQGSSVIVGGDPGPIDED